MFYVFIRIVRLSTAIITSANIFLKYKFYTQIKLILKFIQLYNLVFKEANGDICVGSLNPYNIILTNILKIFEQKMIRKTYGPVKEREIRRMRNSCEIMCYT